MNPGLNILTMSDFIVPFLYVPLLVYLLAIIKARCGWNKPWDRYLVAGFFVRVISVALFALIYQFYYKSGDTFIYYQEAVNMRRALLNGDFDSFRQLVFGNYDDFSFKTLQYIDQDYLYERYNNHLLISIAGLMNILCFNSYMGIGILLAFLGYFGTYLLYRQLCQMFPDYYQILAVILLFFPSTFFWSSGLMKEPICIGAISLIVYAILRINQRQGSYVFSVFIIVISSWLLFMLKSYILYSFAAALLAAGIISTIARSRWVVAHPALALALPILLLSGVFFVTSYLETGLTSNAAQIIIYEIATTQAAQIQASLESGGSGYELSTLEPSPLGIATFASSAFATSLFRPFLWEINKPILVLNALEAILTIAVTVIILAMVGLRSFFTYLFRDYLSLTLIFYTLFMGVVIGVISFNFGTLVRYKAPMLWFYFLALFIIYFRKVNAKQKMEIY